MPFDPSLYTTAPIFNLAAGVTLARALVDACPASMPGLVLTASHKLGDTADRGQERLANHQRMASETSTRLLDSVADGSWAALRLRLLACARLPTDTHPDALVAQRLLDSLFGDSGLAFLKNSYAAQLTTASAILARIDQDGLAADIDRIAGTEYLAHVRDTHTRYDRMVKDMLQNRSADDVGAIDIIRSIQRAIVRYAAAVCATIDEDLPETERVARAALRPIDEFRASNPTRRSNPAVTEPDASNPAPDQDDTNPDTNAEPAVPAES